MLEEPPKKKKNDLFQAIFDDSPNLLLQRFDFAVAEISPKLWKSKNFHRVMFNAGFYGVILGGFPGRKKTY